MKTLSKLAPLLLLTTLIFSGCEKDPLQPEENDLRISKMADNLAMENSILFQYNSDGNINRIEDGILIKTIEYDGQDRPVKVTKVENGRPESFETTNIEWTDDGFIIEETSYLLDAEDRIIERSTPGNTDEYTYDDESSVTIKRKDETGQVYDTFVINFGEVLNPFRHFNVALTYLDYTVFPDDVASHISEYSFSSYVEGNTLNATYEVNEENLPTKGTFTYSGDSSNEYMYYEYETDE